MRLVFALFALLMAQIASANARPDAQPDRYVLRQGESIVVRPPGVLGNDEDADGDTLFLEPVEPAGAGQLILFPDGSFSYTPNERFTGADRFTYQACDDHACADPVEVRIESDGIASPLSARPDRFEIPVGAEYVELNVLDNDAFDASRLDGGRLEVTKAPSFGALEVLWQGQRPHAFLYRPSPRTPGSDRFSYRLCERWGRCVEADAELVLSPFSAVTIDVSSGAGSMDLPLAGLPQLPAPSLMVTEFAKPKRFPVPLTVDATPLEPWAGGGGGQAVFRVDGGDAGRDVRVLVRLDDTALDVDLYVGLDSDGNGRATSDEVACASAMVRGAESCTLDLRVSAGEYVEWWALAHNRASEETVVRMTVLEVDSSDESRLRWSGPGRLEAGARSAFRLSWTDLASLPGDSMQAWIRLDREPGDPIGWTLISTVSEVAEVAPRLLRDEEVVRFDIQPGSQAERLAIDVPLGADSLEVSATVIGEVDLAVFRVPPPSASEGPVDLDRIPPNAVPIAVSERVSGSATVLVGPISSGRWMIRVTGRGARSSEVVLGTKVLVREDAEALLSPGFFAPPTRPGESLLVDRAGADWAGVWYAFGEDGGSTWLYLQGPEPAPGEAWNATIFRSSVGAAGRRLAPVGRASLSIVDDVGPVFSFEVDGRAGSQRLVDLGRGCPVYRGEPRDLSGLWYESGTESGGYGLWVTPQHEFVSVFAHDARGQPRYLIAEAVGFESTAEREIEVVAFRGACVFCQRSARAAFNVGTLTRRFSETVLPIVVDVEASFGPSVQGGVFERSILERLGGDTAGFGCPGKR